LAPLFRDLPATSFLQLGSLAALVRFLLAALTLNRLSSGSMIARR